MANGIVEYIVRLTDKTKAGTASAVKGSKQLEDQTKQTANAVDNLGDESAQTSRQLDRMGKEGRTASGGLKGLARGLSGAVSSVGGLKAGLVGLLGTLGVSAFVSTVQSAAAAVVGFGQEIADLRNDITDASTRSGIAADTLQGLRLAAEGSGLSFSALSGGLDQLGRRMVIAAEGGNATAEAFAALEVDVVDSARKLRSVDDVLRETVNQLNSMKSGAEKTALALDVFGRSGGRVLQALSGAQLQDFVDLASEFGVNVGPEAAKSAGDWQRASEELGTVLDGLKGELFDLVGGADLLFGFAEAAIFTFRTVGGFIGGTVDGIGSALDRMIAPLEAVGRALGDLILALQAVARGDFDAGVNRLSSSMTNLGEAIASGPAAAATLFTGVLEAGAGGIAGAAAGIETAEGQVGRLRELRARIREGGATGSQIITGGDGGDGDGGDGDSTQAAADAAEATARVFASGFAEERPDLNQILADSADNLAAQFEKSAEMAATLRAGRLETAQTAIGVTGQVLGGDIGGGLSSVAGATGLAGLGVAGAAVSGLQFIGDQGAEGIEETLNGVKDGLLGALEALPQLIGEILPEFAVSLVADLIPALIEAGPEILKSILVDLPVAIARALGEILRDAFGRDSENRGRNIGAAIGATIGFVVTAGNPLGAAAGAGAGAAVGAAAQDIAEGSRGERGRSAARTASDGQASGARASDRLAAMSTRPRRRGATVVAQNPYDQLAQQYDAQYGTYGRATSTTIRGA